MSHNIDFKSQLPIISLIEKIILILDTAALIQNRRGMNLKERKNNLHVPGP